MSRFSTPAKRDGEPSLIPQLQIAVGRMRSQVVDDDRRSGVGAEVSASDGLRDIQAAGHDVVTVEAEAHRGDIG
jgi:hypothetical protein